MVSKQARVLTADLEQVRVVSSTISGAVLMVLHVPSRERILHRDTAL